MSAFYHYTPATDGSSNIMAYEVEVRDGGELGDAELPPPRPGLLPGPYRAETIPVRVDGRYVVLELD